MRLLIATPLYPPEIGGPATYAKSLVDGLGAHGIEVEVVKFSDVRHLPKLIRHIAYYRRVLKVARHADAILALDPVSVGLPALWAAKRAGTPLVVKIVGDYAWEQGRQRFGLSADLDEFVATPRVPLPVEILRRIQTHVAGGASRVIVPSEYLKKIVTTWGVHAEKIHVIYNAVPAAELGVVPALAASAPRPLIVTAGRLVPWKQVEGIINAVAHIPGATLAIAGDGPLFAALARRSTEALGTRGIMTGKLAHADLLALIKGADVFVLNSSYEGLSHLLIEAQMLGVPTIATRVGGNAEVIRDDESGVLVPNGDTETLSMAIAQVLDDAELRAKLAHGAIESAKRFTEVAMLSATAALLKQV